MSAHSYVTCLLCRVSVPREEAIGVDHYQAAPERRRHVCHRCVGRPTIAREEHSRCLALASWRSTIDAARRGRTNIKEGAQNAS